MNVITSNHYKLVKVLNIDTSIQSQIDTFSNTID